MSDIKQSIINLLIDKLNEEFILQGHPNTGEFQKSLRGEFIENEDKTTIHIYGNEYGLYISKGVSADKIPFTDRKRGEGAGGQSKYITGLKNWVKTKLGIADEREALSIAFAIAKQHSITGMPVRGGQLGSGFIDDVSKKYKDEVDNLILIYLEQKIKKTI